MSKLHSFSLFFLSSSSLQPPNSLLSPSLSLHRKVTIQVAPVGAVEITVNPICNCDCENEVVSHMLVTCTSCVYHTLLLVHSPSLLPSLSRSLPPSPPSFLTYLPLPSLPLLLSSFPSFLSSPSVPPSLSSPLS